MPDRNEQQRGVDRPLFESAAQRALAYLDRAFERRVFPDEAALAGLEAFDEALPDNEVVLNQIVASIGGPELTEQVRRRVEADGDAWFGPTDWQGRPAVRFSVSSWATTETDIALTLAAVERAVAAVRETPRAAAPLPAR